MLNKVFRTVSNGELVKVIEVNEKTKTVLVELPDGKTRSYSPTTLKDKRRFIPVESDEELVAEVMKQKEELGIEVPKITEAPEIVEEKLVPMPGAEKLADLKKKEKGTGTSRILIEYRGSKKTPIEWGRLLGLDPKYIRAQLRKGKTPEEIFKEKK